MCVKGYSKIARYWGVCIFSNYGFPQIYAQEWDAYTPMFTAALIRTAKTWKQPKCPTTEEWIKKMWYFYIMEYYSAIKKNDNVICSNMDGPRDYHSK